MVKHDYPEHFAADAKSAISLAQKLKAEGQYDLFRGQRHTFAIRPSAFRDSVSPEVVTNSLNRFATWLHQTPALSSLHNNRDAIIAVAQHYGMATPFLDFSYSPEIAGFFATHGGVKGDTGTIICINRRRFVESWKDINERHQASEGWPLTGIVEIDVKNLWRLQAQEGAFVRCHVDSTMLEMFSFMLHIYFPQEPGTAILDQDNIYPRERSHLEVLLDQYFLIESYPKRERTLLELFGHKIAIEENTVGAEIRSYFVSEEIPKDHESWNSANTAAWLIEPEEKHDREVSRQVCEMQLPNTRSRKLFQNTIESQTLRAITEAGRGNVGFLAFDVVFNNGSPAYINGDGKLSRKSDEWTLFQMSEMVNVIYSGMRYLPYQDWQIARAIARYIAIGRFGAYKVINNTEGVEFSGAGVRGRGFCDRERLLGAIRPDFMSLIKPKRLNRDGAMEFRDLFFAARYVKSSYAFEGFVNLFVEDLIPTQAAVAVEKLVIGLNPILIDVFGES